MKWFSNITSDFASVLTLTNLTDLDLRCAFVLVPPLDEIAIKLTNLEVLGLSPRYVPAVYRVFYKYCLTFHESFKNY